MREKSLFLDETHLKLMELTAIVFISSSSPYHFKTFLACHLDITFTQVLRRKLGCLIIMQIRQNRHIFDRKLMKSKTCYYQVASDMTNSLCQWN